MKVQSPKPPALEIWDDYGDPVERVPVTDARWKFTGPWQNEPKSGAKVSAEKGAEATVTFTGTGAIVTGTYLVDGGTFDAYLDGKLRPETGRVFGREGAREAARRYGTPSA